MRPLLFALAGLLAYLFFFGTFLHLAAFVEGLPLVKTLDSGIEGPLAQAVVIDVLLLALFAVQHSVMARPAFKRAWTRIVPHQLERSTYVLLASAVLALMIWQWRPIGGTVWSLEGTAAQVMTVLSYVGWGVVLISTFLINHFELFGLRQSFAEALGLPDNDTPFRTPGFYRYVRHPIYLGFLIAFWATPVMTGGHFLFALVNTAYILLGIFFEERDLMVQFGAQYARYRQRAGMLLPRLTGAGQHQVLDRNESRL